MTKAVLAGEVLNTPMVTLYDGDGVLSAYHDARALLQELKPRVVQLHAWNVEEAAEAVRRDNQDVQLLAGFGIDGVARAVTRGDATIGSGVSRLRQLAQRARRSGFFAVKWNAEAAWKVPPTNVQAARLDELIVNATSEVQADGPGLVQLLTTYDHPTYHSKFRWRAWARRRGASPSPIAAVYFQVYAAPGGDVRAHRGALQAREASSFKSIADAVRVGLLDPDAPVGTPEDTTDVDFLPYYQLHHGNYQDTVQQALKFPSVALWALRSRSDDDGRRATVALVAFSRLGLWGPDAINEVQRRSGLTVDGKYGPLTELALFSQAGISATILAR